MGTQNFQKLIQFDILTLLMGVIYLFIFYLLGVYFFARHFSVSKKFFFKLALRAHLFSGFVFGLYHIFIYVYADTAVYFSCAQALNNYFGYNLSGYFQSLYLPNLIQNYDLLFALDFPNISYGLIDGLYMVIKIVSIINIFSFNNYFASTIIIAFIAFLTSWRFYEKIILIYPKVNNAIFRNAVLFYPSILFWGNGISKDTICVICLFSLFINLINVLILKKALIKNLFFFLVALYILAVIKSYIAFVLLPCILIWVASIYIVRIRNIAFRKLIYPILIVFSIFAGILFSNGLTKLDGRFSGNASLTERASIQQTNLQKAGSSYSLGVDTKNPILTGLLGIATTLFRPFLWEVSNPFMILAFLESFIITILCYFIFIKWGIKKAFKFILNDNFIVFSLIFTLIFSAGIGASSGNFGTLVRYKIPCLPFFGISILLLFNQYTLEVPYKFQSRLHKFLAKYLLNQKAPDRFVKTYINTPHPHTA